jgi:small subunit ribosomal protein S20
MRNRGRRSRLRTSVRSFVSAIDSGDLQAGPERLNETLRLVDRAANQGIVHRNAASRRKSRLMKRLNAAALAAETVAGGES